MITIRQDMRHNSFLKSAIVVAFTHVCMFVDAIYIFKWRSFPHTCNNDVAHFLSDSRAVLVEFPDDSDPVYDPYRDVFDDRKRGKKVQRTHSDLTGTKRKKRERKYDSPYDLESRPSHRGKREESDHRHKGSVDSRLPRTASAEVHERQPRDHKHREMRHNMNGVRSDNKDTKPEVNEQELSQTDSAKLRAMQDKSKDHVDGKPASSQWNHTSEELKLNLPKDSDDEDLGVTRYEYSGHLTRDGSSDRRGEVRNQVNESTFVSVKVRPDMYEKNGYDNQGFSEEDPPSSRAPVKGRARADSNTDGKVIPLFASTYGSSFTKCVNIIHYWAFFIWCMVLHGNCAFWLILKGFANFLAHF